MATLAEVRETAIEVARRALPEEVAATVIAAETLDWQGEPSISISYVLPDQVFRRGDVGDLLLELSVLLQEALIEAGERRFAYVNLVSQTDLEEDVA